MGYYSQQNLDTYEQYEQENKYLEAQNLTRHRRASNKAREDLRQKFYQFCRAYRDYDIIIEKQDLWICQGIRGMETVVNTRWNSNYEQTDCYASDINNIYVTEKIIVGGEYLSCSQNYTRTYATLMQEDVKVSGGVTSVSISSNSSGGYDASPNYASSSWEKIYKIQHGTMNDGVTYGIHVKIVKKGTAEEIIKREKALQDNADLHFAAKKYKGENIRDRYDGRKKDDWAKHWKLKKSTTTIYSISFLALLLCTLVCIIIAPYAISWGDKNSPTYDNWSNDFIWLRMNGKTVEYSSTALIFVFVLYVVAIASLIFIQKVKARMYSKYSGGSVFDWLTYKVKHYDSNPIHWVKGVRTYNEKWKKEKPNVKKDGNIIVWYDWNRCKWVWFLFISLSAVVLTIIIGNLAHSNWGATGISSLIKSLLSIASLLLTFALLVYTVVFVVMSIPLLFIGIIPLCIDKTYNHHKETVETLNKYIKSEKYAYWEKVIKYLQSFEIKVEM